MISSKGKVRGLVTVTVRDCNGNVKYYKNGFWRRVLRLPEKPMIFKHHNTITNQGDGMIADLMISNPIDYVDAFIKAGADLISFHVESNSDISETIEKITSAGKKAALVVKPKTSVDVVFPYLKDISMVLIMTVEPGFGGQSFMEPMIPKITELRQEIEKQGLQVDIQVDGGVDNETAVLCKNAGANVLVAGSYIFKSPDTKEAIDILKS